MRIYDISVPIKSDTPVYPGDPGINITASHAIAKGDAANVSKLDFGAHTATHIDAPAHFIEGARQVKDIPLETLIGAARVIEFADEVEAIDAHDVAPDIVRGATRVLFKTRNSKFWMETPPRFHEDFTYVTGEAAKSLVAQGVALVGIDYLSIEKFHSEDFAAHLTLLANETVILEGLNLSGVEAGVYELICLPLKIASGAGDGAPARAILRELKDQDL
jgi:arylformamidase